MYHHHIFIIVLSHPPPFCRVDLSSRDVLIGLLKEEAMDILSQTHLNTLVNTTEISIIVRVIFPSGSTFPARVIGRILTEGLIPFNIHLSTTPRTGYYRVAFKNESILRNFFHNMFHSQPVVFDAQNFNPVQIQFCFESIPCECCDKGLASCLISCFKNLGVHINTIPETGIFHFQLPSTDSLFVAFVDLFQKIGSPISI